MARLPLEVEKERLKFLKDLALTKNYTRKDLKDAYKKQYGVNVRDDFLNKAIKGITLPSGRGLVTAAKQSADKSVYLKNYTFEDLERDIKAGKSRGEIVDDILKKNPSDVKDIRRLTLGALKSRIVKRPELEKLDFLNQKNLIKEKRKALKDLKNFVNKNKEAYKKVYASNKVGAVSGFKEKVLDYVSQNYPKLINRSKGGRDILTGQRIFTGFDLLGRDVTKKGEYGRDLELNKIIRKSLGIPERPLKGEGESIDRLNRAYNKNITNLLKEAQKQGKIPLIDPKTGNKINSEAAYTRYIDRKVIDPVRNLFGKYFQFGTEHMGGVARANLINDVDALNQIAALDSFTNKFDKGANVDQKVTTLIKLAKQSSGDTAKDYLETANKLLKESDAKYGLDSTKYKLVKNEIIPIQPNEENIFKRAVTAFTATERYKDPNFKLLDPDLKKSIMAFKKGSVEKGTKFLKSAVQTLISKTENLSKADQLRFCSLLANGGLPGDCKQALKADPEKAAQVLSDAPATNKAAAEVKDSAQKVISAFRTPVKPTELTNLPETNLKYNSELGAFENVKTQTVAPQSEIKQYAIDNPMEVKVGEPAKLPKPNKSVLKTVGKTLAAVGAPLPTLLLDSYFINKQVEEGKSTAEIASNPLNWLGLATMSPLTKAAGLADKSGKLSSVLRLGLNPGTISGISRFAGLPGLAISTAVTAYDQYNKYKNQEGFIYKLFNKEES